MSKTDGSAKPGTGIVAIVCSDVHFSINAPPCRRGEPSWLAAQERVWAQVVALAELHRDARVLIAGDIFDRWDAPPELLNCVIHWFKNTPTDIYAIPGQHDLPQHNYGERRRSAYGTLIEADIIKNIHPENPISYTAGPVEVSVTGVPWGYDLAAAKRPRRPGWGPRIALVHKYIWAGVCKHPGARQADHLRSVFEAAGGYDVVAFGDNHLRFFRATEVAGRTQSIINCGAMQRRTADQIDYDPHVYLIDAAGAVYPVALDITGDVFEARGDAAPVAGSNPDLDSFIYELHRAADECPSFGDSLRRYLEDNRTGADVAKLLLDSIGG